MPIVSIRYPARGAEKMPARPMPTELSDTALINVLRSTSSAR